MGFFLLQFFFAEGHSGGSIFFYPRCMCSPSHIRTWLPLIPKDDKLTVKTVAVDTVNSMTAFETTDMVATASMLLLANKA